MRRQREEEARRQREEEELGVMAYKTAEEAKLAGNKFIGAEDYKKALECYTRAIELDETVPAYFGNRGQCHLKLGDWRAALADSMRAVEVDAAGTFGKGWIRAGVCFQPHASVRNGVLTGRAGRKVCHVRLGEFEEARGCLKKAIAIKVRFQPRGPCMIAQCVASVLTERVWYSCRRWARSSSRRRRRRSCAT
jgi:tetratricopeptide (TPR) repeat protein